MEIHDAQIGLDDLSRQAEAAASMMSMARAHLLARSETKTTPLFHADEVAQMCGVPKSSFTRRLTSPNFKDMPSGTLSKTGRRRLFTVLEARAWIKSYRKEKLRPKYAEAVTISVANSKGGTTKTTTAMTLAQGLTLLGHHVLIIDTDPQASLTTLFGLSPDVEIEPRHTVFALIDGSQTSIQPLIRNTYWDGLDLVPAASSLFRSELFLAAQQRDHKEFEFWSVLNLSLYEVKHRYDVIVIDTPSAFSYLTINALMASDGIIMPLPPETSDYASAGQFWKLFAELTSELLINRGATKKFDFINILLSRVDLNETTNMVREWITQTYGSKVLPLEIPHVARDVLNLSEFGTVYDNHLLNSKDRTVERARVAYALFVNHIESSLMKTWNRQLRADGMRATLPALTMSAGGY